MAFKIKATLIEFMGDVERFPCHFGYKKGDSFIYDGEEFVGRVCPGVLTRIGAYLTAMRIAGPSYAENIAFRYTGLSARDESMAQYDGVGFRNLKQPPEGCLPQHLTGHHPVSPWQKKEPGGFCFGCADARTSAFFYMEPVDLCSRGYDVPYYNRCMSLLEKVKAEPGLTVDAILGKFTEWERNEIYPLMTRVVAEILLDELRQVNYLEVREGKYYPQQRGLEKDTSKVMVAKRS